MAKKIVQELIDNWYKQFQDTIHPEAISYQKAFRDEKGKKYFISAQDWQDLDRFLNRNWSERVDFSAQFTVNDRCIEVRTLQRFTDSEAKRRSYPTLQEVEDMFEKMRIAYGQEYYELYPE